MQDDQPFAGRQETGSYERNHQYGESLRACCQWSKRALATNIRQEGVGIPFKRAGAFSFLLVLYR